jgi:prolyl-tRNA editing enzyme YbaK/EbsC (Cys-tRNA(Pro) deacylase)
MNVEQTKRMMEEFGFKGEIILHKESGRTSEDAARALGVPVEKIVKSLLFRSKDGSYVGAILLGTSKADVRKLEKLSGLKKLRLARKEEVLAFTGFKAGGVPPIAFKGKCKVFVDEKVFSHDWVIGAGGTEYSGLKFDPSELLKLGYVKEDISKRQG